MDLCRLDANTRIHNGDAAFVNENGIEIELRDLWNVLDNRAHAQDRVDK